MGGVYPGYDIFSNSKTWIRKSLQDEEIGLEYLQVSTNQAVLKALHNNRLSPSRDSNVTKVFAGSCRASFLVALCKPFGMFPANRALGHDDERSTRLNRL